ncbi:MAG: MBOAT family protein, partial [Mogibacterium sp.]|nr:MBOAT family protein [Mogibacterium sp.]
QMIWLTLTDQSIPTFMEQVRTLGLSKPEYAAVLVCTLVLLYFSIRMEKESVDTPAEIIVKHNGFIQWAALFLLFICILIVGVYGPMADPADFIYMQF